MVSNHSKIMGVIPARYGSSRFPGKILAKINGKPMIQRVYERASQSRLLNELLVAVDDERVKQCVEAFGGTAIMTDPALKSGTDRIAVVVRELAADIIVNIQGDQPLIHPKMIDAAVEPMLKNPTIKMSTLKTEIMSEDFDDPGVVKVVTDETGFALYFSRSLIPYPREAEDLKVYEHIGTYVYQKDFLIEISQIPQGFLEKIESLEQLRVLEKGHKIFVVNPDVANLRLCGMSVDTPADLAKAEKYIQQLGL